jgi:MFS transporter, OPA family, sugar phosphate sensor protein UhpC
MATDLTAGQRSWRWRIFAITWLAYAGFYLCRRNLSVAMPLLVSHLKYSNFQLANVIFGYSVCYAIGQFLAGTLADRFGSRMIVTIGLSIAVLANFFIGFFPFLSALAVLCCLNGLGQATGWPGLIKNTAPWFRHSERGVVMGWWTTNYVLGGFLAMLFVSFAVTERYLGVNWGWRRAFWFPALLLAVVALVYALFARNRPEDVGLAPIVDEETELPAVTVEPSDAVPEPSVTAANGRHPMWGVISDLQIWALAAGCAFSKIPRYSLLYWLPLYMTERLHYSPARAGYTASLYEFVGFGGALIAGYASDKLCHSRRLPVVSIMFWGLGLVFCLHPHMATWGGWAVAASVSMLGIMNYGPDTLLQGAASQDAGAKWGVGVTSGFISAVGSCGQLISPFLVAWVAQRFGWDRLFYWFAGIAFLSGCLLATQWRREASIPPA